MISQVKKFKTLFIVVLVLGGLGFGIFKIVTKPLPGEAVAQLGRDHVTDISGITYSSNPPTSGSHFPVWAKPGVYDRLISDGYFIHSMEHGYIILWYDCSKPLVSKSLISSVFAHGDEPVEGSTSSGTPLTKMTVQPQGNMSWITPQSEPGEEVALPDSFKTDSCKSLVNQLSEFTKVAPRVVVTPRVGMDNPITLTAWGRILRLNNIDQKVITNFIKTFHNRGPEQTME